MVVDEYKVSLLIRKFRVVELVPPGEIPVHLALLDDSPHHFIPIRDSLFQGAAAAAAAIVQLATTVMVPCRMLMDGLVDGMQHNNEPFSWCPL